MFAVCTSLEEGGRAFLQTGLCGLREFIKSLTGNGVYGIIPSVCEAAGRPRAERCEESPSSAGQSAG